MELGVRLFISTRSSNNIVILFGFLETGHIRRVGAISRIGTHRQFPKKVLYSQSGIILSGN